MGEIFSKLEIPASSVCCPKDDTFLVAHRGINTANIHLTALSGHPKIKTDLIASFEGSRNFLLKNIDRKIFIGVDNQLLLNEQGSWDLVVRSKNTSNVFWHMCKSSNEMLYVQEYGQPPTNIYMSGDGRLWEYLATSKDVDSTAKHFHSICYDPYRKMLIATFGDGNLVRIAVLMDNERKWRRVYGGAWQVLPIVVQENVIVFGMDSGITNGGLVLWYPDQDRFEVLHLRWLGRSVRFMQMSDLKLLSNRIWVAALGRPQALIASLDLENWYSIYVESLDAAFNHLMAICEGKEIVALTTGKGLVFITKRDLPKLIAESQVAIVENKGIRNKLMGVGSVLKKRANRALKFEGLG